MAKFYGAVGYVESVETAPGVYEDKTTERNYSGDVIRNTGRWNNDGKKLNDDLNVSNIISILADPFAYQNFHTIKYVKWMGVAWKVTNVDVLYPRLHLTMGGVYNEPTNTVT